MTRFPISAMSVKLQPKFRLIDIPMFVGACPVSIPSIYIFIELLLIFTLKSNRFMSFYCGFHSIENGHMDIDKEFCLKMLSIHPNVIITQNAHFAGGYCDQRLNVVISLQAGFHSIKVQLDTKWEGPNCIIHWVHK